MTRYRTRRGLLACLALALAAPGIGQGAGPRPAPRDPYGDPLPQGALARLGTGRLCHPDARWLAFSPDGKTLASADMSGTVRLWRLGTGEQLRQMSMPRVLSYGWSWQLLAFSPDGKLLAAGDGGGAVRVWDVATGVLRYAVRPGARLISTLAFSPDGKRLAAGGQGGPVYLLDSATGRLLGRWGEFTLVTSLAFSPGGRALLAAGPLRDDWSKKACCRFDVATGRKLREETFGKSHVLGELAPGGRLAVADAGRRLALYDPFTGKEVRRLRGKVDGAWQFAFSSGGEFVSASADDGVARVWETATGKLAHSFRALPTGIKPVALSRDGKLLALLGRADYAVHVFDVARGKELHAFGGHRSGPLNVAFSADGKTLFTASRDGIQSTPVSEWADWSLRRWDLAGRELAVTAADPGGEVHWTAFSPGGSLLLRVTHEGTLRVYDARSGKELRSWKVPTRDGSANGRKFPRQAIHYPAFSADGKTVLAAAESAVLRWDAATGKELPPLKTPHNFLPRLLAGPDGRNVFVTQWTRAGVRVALLGGASGRRLRTFPAGSSAYPPMAVSADGRTLAVWDDKGVRLWEVAGGGERNRVGTVGFVGAVAFSPDGRLLAWGGGKDGEVVLWDLASNRHVRRFEGHRTRVQTLAFSHGGDKLASAGLDNFVLVWRVPRGGKRRGARLTRADRERLWNDLSGEDAARAYQAIWELAAAPRQGVPLLERRLKGVLAGPDAKRVARLVAELDDDKFAVRERATRELERLGRDAERPLRRALEGEPSDELRERAEELLRRLERGHFPTRELIALRVVEALEHAGTAEARAALRRLATTHPEPGLTLEAKSALRRLERRTDKP